MNSKFLYNPVEKGLFCHCPTLLQSKTGDILVSWYTYPENEYEKATLVLTRQHGADGQWQNSKTILKARGYSIGNPVLFQEPGDRVWLLFVVLKGRYWNDAILEGVWSDDDGNSWSDPVQLWKDKGLMVRHPPLLLENGSLLLPAYKEDARQSVMLSAAPPYSKWEEIYQFNGRELIQPALIREASGRLLLFFRPWTNPRRIWLSRSAPNGLTWSEPTQTTLPNPLSGISAFVSKNIIGIVHNNTEKHQRHPLSISISKDAG
ncbi:MAG: exo-alpha-sialidase, partial [Nitrospinae bacterium]|nr:exo-alpha-sialidase [Nitrospinota bacterium]